MRILFVSRWYPFPPNNGSRIRVFNLIRHLASQYEVDLISFASEPVDEGMIDGLRPYCRKIWFTNYDPERNGTSSKLLGYFSSRPRSVVSSYNDELQRQVDEAEKHGEYDLLISSQVDMAPYTQNWQASPKIFEELELTSLYEQSYEGNAPLQRLRNRMTWWKQMQYLPSVLKGFQGCTVVSEQERRRALGVLPESVPIEVIPNGVDVDYYQGDFGPRQADTLIYSGALTYSANFDAIRYFLGEVLPLVKEKRPTARLLITGSTKGVDLNALPAAEGVEFTGYVEDIRPIIARSHVSVVPLRIGGGTRLKILEALALGTPVVSTGKGAEGLDLIPGQEFLRADTPQTFAAAILDLLDSPPLVERLSCQGREAVEQRYDWKKIGKKLDAFLQQTLVGTPFTGRRGKDGDI